MVAKSQTWLKQLQSVQFSHSVMSDSLRPHGLQHIRPSCPSPTPRVYSNSCPLSQWCHPTISSSIVPFSSRLQSFPASGSFQMNHLFTSGQNFGVSASTSVLPMNIQDWFPLGGTFFSQGVNVFISWLQSPSAVILEPHKIKSATDSPSICHEVMRLDVMILVFWMLSFKPTFSLSFTFIKRLFSSSSLSAIRVVSSAYLRLLIFLPVILIPACASSSPAFLMMYSEYKLNKQGDSIQPWRTPFPICNLAHIISILGASLVAH